MTSIASPTASPPAMRIAHVRVVDFSLSALLRASPELSGLPLAVIQGAGTHATILQASPEARAGGVLPGLGVARARQRLPELKALPPSPEAEHGAQATLLEIAFAFAPRVAESGPGAVYLDLSGMGRVGSEPAIATALDSALARVGLPCHIGVGANKTIARVAALAGEGVVVVPPGKERSFLEPLPVRLLEPSAELLARLDAWGVHKLGALARLSERSVARRLGAEGVALRQLALGQDGLPFVSAMPPQSFEESMSFDDWALDNLEPLLAVLGELVDRLLDRLQRRGLAAQALVTTLALEPRGHDVRHVEFAAPLTDRRAILELLRHELSVRPARAAIGGVRAVAIPAAPQAVQGHLFAPADPTPERLAITLARLHALVGEGRVGAPVRPARRTPGAVALAPFAATRSSPAATFGDRSRSDTVQPQATRSSPSAAPGHQQQDLQEAIVRATRPAPSAPPGDRSRSDTVQHQATRSSPSATPNDQQQDRQEAVVQATQPAPSAAPGACSHSDTVQPQATRPAPSAAPDNQEIGAFQSRWPRGRSPHARNPGIESPARAGAAPARAGAAPTLAVSILRPPRLISVDLAKPGSGPSAVYLDGRRHVVRRCAGPWRFGEGWWTAEPTCRDDYDLELDDGRLIRIYRELCTGSWFWDGVYG